MTHFASITKVQERFAPKAGLVWKFVCHTCGNDADFASSQDLAFQILNEDREYEYDGDLIIGDGQQVRVAETNADFPMDVEKASTLFGRTLAYLPGNYRVDMTAKGRTAEGELRYTLKITGIDMAGWTLDGYVLPRLASGNIFFNELEVK